MVTYTLFSCRAFQRAGKGKDMSLFCSYGYFLYDSNRYKILLLTLP